MGKRLVTATGLAFVLLAPTAGAKYLHLSEAQSAANRYLHTIRLPETLATGGTIDRCWHAGRHVVRCASTEVPGYSTPEHHVVVIALRGDKLYGHTVGQDRSTRIR